MFVFMIMVHYSQRIVRVANMVYKKIILAFVGLFLISLVSAQLSNGTIFTQQQLDNINISAVTPSQLQCHWKNNTFVRQDKVWTEFSCLTVFPQGTEYVLLETQYHTRIPMPHIVRCLRQKTLAECRTLYIQTARDQALSTIDYIKEIAIGYQTDPDEQTIIDWLRNLAGF